MLKTHEYQLKQINKTGDKNVATNENCIPLCILRKMRLKLQNPRLNILCKLAFWNNQIWLNRKLII